MREWDMHEAVTLVEHTEQCPLEQEGTGNCRGAIRDLLSPEHAGIELISCSRGLGHHKSVSEAGLHFLEVETWDEAAAASQLLSKEPGEALSPGQRLPWTRQQSCCRLLPKWGNFCSE